MFKRIVCLLTTLLLMTLSACSLAEEQTGVHSWRFDLSFSLNRDAFPPLSQSRAQGYRDLLERLRLQGTVVWVDRGGSLDLNATVFFEDKPDVAVSFRLYGTRERLCLTSPLLNGETVLFNMAAFMEYALKVKSTLNVPLPFLAFLYPYTTEHAFRGPVQAWNKTIRKVKNSRKIPVEKLKKVSALWDEKLQNDQYLNIWINALASGSSAPEAVEMEFFDFPFYFNDYVWAGHRLQVEIGKGTETWKNRQGQVLFTREQTENTDSWTLSLPPSQNRYAPYCSWTRTADGQEWSFTLNASWLREAKKTAAPAADAAPSEEEKTEVQPEDTYSEEAYTEKAYTEEGYSEEGYSEEGYSEEYSEEYGEYGEEEESDYDEDGSSSWPDVLLLFSAEGQSLPLSLPADASFTVSADLSGALFPDNALTLVGNTKKDGALTVSLCKPDGESLVELLSCEGTLVPYTAEAAPSFDDDFHEGAFSLFSFNEEKLAAFKKQVFPSLLKGLVRFVAEAPASACQSFLDDLADVGLLDMLLE